MSKELDATQLIAAMCTAYSNVDWYQDSGYVLKIFGQHFGEEYTTRMDFSTHFCRPNLFRFEWSEGYVEKSSDQVHAVWSDGCRVYKKYGSREAELVQNNLLADSDVINDLGLAIAGATGVSSGAAIIVSSLLLPIFDCNEMIGLREVRYVGDEVLNGELCHCVQGSWPQRKSKLWISSTRNILLKLREHYEIDPDYSSKGYENIESLFKKHDNQSLGKENMRILSSEALAVRKVTVYQSVALNMQFPLEIFTR